MHKLETNDEPFWLDILPGQRTQVRPIRTKMVLVARAAGRAAITADPDNAQEASNEAFTRAIVKQGIVAWEGVGDAKGDPVPVTPENIDAYIANWRVYDAMDRLYVLPAIVRVDEKNASSLSQNGTSGAKIPARDSAATARKNAKRVRTASTRRKRRTASPPGPSSSAAPGSSA